nr:acetoacetyl-CoA synthetase isoform X3 [Globicephala melas]
MSKEPRGGREEILECQVMWEPDSKKNTQMDRFRAVVGAAYGLALENYDDLYHWSVESYSDFWAEFWKFSGIVFSHTYDEVVDMSKGIADVPEWFKGSRLNYAENLLQHRENDGVALYVAREGREEIVKVSFEELRRQVALYAAAMRKMGVRRGDRVVGYLPNSAHAVEAMLAATSIGAIWSSTSPDFGVNGVLDRFSQIQPKLIFSVEAVVYNGKEHDHVDKLQQVVRGLADLKKVVVIPYVSSREKIDISRIPNSVFLEDFLATGQGAQAPQLEFEQLPFSHPLFIMFSSGTTGAPKCMVHSVGGTLIQHLKEHILHGNMTSSDIILYYTTLQAFLLSPSPIVNSEWCWVPARLCQAPALSDRKPSPGALMEQRFELQNPTPGAATATLTSNSAASLGHGRLDDVELDGVCSRHGGGRGPIRRLPAGAHPQCALGPGRQNRHHHPWNRCEVAVSAGRERREASGNSQSADAAHDPVHRLPPERPELRLCLQVAPTSCLASWARILQFLCTKGKFRPGTWAWPWRCGTRKERQSGGRAVNWCVPSRSPASPRAFGTTRTAASTGRRISPNSQVSGCTATTAESTPRPRASSCWAEATAHSTPTECDSAARKSITSYTLNGKKVEMAVKQIIAGKTVEHHKAFSNPETLDLYRDVPELQDF